MKVQFEIIPEDLVSPERSEDLIGVLPVLELLIELIRPACMRNTTVESDESEGEVPSHHLTGPHLLIDYATLAVMQE